MSSHHFVKEGQEPALFILEGTSFEHVEQLLEWVPLVLVADGAVETVLRWGIKIDVIFACDSEFSNLVALVKHQQPLQIMACEKSNLIGQALTFLSGKRQAAVNILGPQTEEIMNTVEKIRLPIRIGVYADHCKWSWVTRGKFEKWMPKGSALFIRDTPGSSLQTEGIIQKGGIWTTETAGMLKILSDAPFWVGEPI
jgi:hypothetical protein